MATSSTLPTTLTSVAATPGKKTYSGAEGDFSQLDHRSAMAAANATVALSFTPYRLGGDQVLVSKDGRGNMSGDFTLWVDSGTLLLSVEHSDKTSWVRVPDLVLIPGQEHHVAVSFGEDGLQIWFDGELAAAEPSIKVDLTANTRDMVVGGTRAWRDADDDPATPFAGEIGNVYMFNSQISVEEAVGLAANASASLGMSAMHAEAMADLMPAFDQMHHGSDVLEEIVADYGLGGHDQGYVHGGVMPRMLTMISGTDADETLKGSDADDGIHGGGGDDEIRGEGGDNVLQGGYGNDVMFGRQGRDVLDGGHGEDKLVGGAGADVLISRADAREPRVSDERDGDQMDPYGELTNGKVYPGVVHGDDLLIGGDGGDIFYFQTLINAKARYVEEHTTDDGSINWHGVAGENDKLHDHWVDMIGNDVIQDFDRSEGDRIIIEGHTTQIKHLNYIDKNGDGVMDATVIQLYSQQGNGGGAHDEDLLGTVTVYGDMLRLSDIEHTASPAYGIVSNINDLDEAVAPVEESVDTGRIKTPGSTMGSADTLSLKGKPPVLALPGTHMLTGAEGEYLDVGASEDLQMSNATFSLAFKPYYLPGEQALFAMDGRDNYDGDLTVWMKNGELVVSLQDGERTEWLTIPDLVLMPNETHHLAVSVGKDGLMVWLDGTLAAAEPEMKADLTMNDRALVVGASRAWRSTQTEEAHSEFIGEISDVQVYGHQITTDQAIKLAGHTSRALGREADKTEAMADLMPAFDQVHHGSDTFAMIATQYGLGGGHHDDMAMMMQDAPAPRELKMITGTKGNDDLKGGDEDDGINGLGGNDKIRGEGGDNVLQGGSGNDKVYGKNGKDVLDGGHGEDKLFGGKGADLLISRSDAREPDITFVPERDESDPYNELTDGKLYPDQPIPGDDMMVGGGGADIFYFQTLINAKERYIEEHTNDDGSIRWHGVAGENDKLHDHWVDGIGNDSIMDFNRDQGDRIVIEGHTTEIKSLVYRDANGDGVLDKTVISLYSDQGNNGGAHQYDDLGTITVYGDLVKWSDIEHTDSPAYGIVQGIDDLDAALAPSEVSKDLAKIQPFNKFLPKVGDTKLEDGTRPVVAIVDAAEFVREMDDAVVIKHSNDLELSDGTIAMTFSKTSDDWMGLFSKDHTGYGPGGHMTTYVEEDGDLILRFQTVEKDHYLIARNVIETGETYDLAVTFGGKGAELWLNGALVAYDADLEQGLGPNGQDLVVGANSWSSTAGTLDRVSSHFNGTIESFAIYEGQLSGDDLGHTPPAASTVSLDRGVEAYSFAGSPGALTISRPGESVTTTPDTDWVTFNDRTIRAQDIAIGTNGNDTFEGAHGAEIFFGSWGDDKAYGRGNDDFLSGEDGNDSLNGDDGRDTLLGGNGDDHLYGADQADVIEGGAGNDDLKGGNGSDTFRGGFGDDYFYGHTWGEEGTARKDTVIFDGNLADYTFFTETFWHSSRGVDVTRLKVTDSPSGGSDGFYEGTDRLMDIDVIVFADQTVRFDDLI